MNIQEIEEAAVVKNNQIEKKRSENQRIETKLQIAKYKQKNHEKNVKNFFKANMAMVLSRDIENS